MFKHATSVIRSALSTVSPDPTPPWREDGVMSLWWYRPDPSRLQDRVPFGPMIVIARAWSYAGQSGVVALDLNYWLHGHDQGRFNGSGDEIKALWQIETDERFAANIQGGRLGFIAVLPKEAAPVFADIYDTANRSAAEDAARPVDSHP
jgi:hypothetical protein